MFFKFVSFSNYLVLLEFVIKMLYMYAIVGFFLFNESDVDFGMSCFNLTWAIGSYDVPKKILYVN